MTEIEGMAPSSGTLFAGFGGGFTISTFCFPAMQASLSAGRGEPSPDPDHLREAALRRLVVNDLPDEGVRRPLLGLGFEGPDLATLAGDGEIVHFASMMARPLAMTFSIWISLSWTFLFSEGVSPRLYWEVEAPQTGHSFPSVVPYPHAPQSLSSQIE